MNSSELRVGNWVQYNYFPMYVVAVYQDGTVYCDFEGNEGDVWEFDKKNPCEPIPLTERILLKCGFEQESIKHQYSLGLITLQLPNENNYHKKGRIYYNSWAIKNECVEYLHQLQNLYWCLTNEELNVKL